MGKAAKKSVYTNSSKKHSGVKNGSTKSEKERPAGKKTDKGKQGGCGCCKVFMFIIVCAGVAGVAVLYSNDEYRVKSLEMLDNVQREAMKQYEENIKPLLKGEDKEKEKQAREEAKIQEESKERDEEKRLKREAEEKMRKEELKRQKEEEKKKEEERRKKEAEEKKLREEKEKQEREKKKREEEERKKMEEEKKRLEEEKRRQDEIKKKEEEKKKKEEEIKRKMEEEKRKAEEAEKKKQEEERKQKEAEEKRKEEERLKAEKKQKEEQKKKEEELKRKAEEERKAKEEEQKRQEAEKKRLEEEKKKKEEELKRKAEEEKKRQEAEKKQKEEEQKRLEAEKKRIEEENKKKEEELKRKAEEEKKKQEAERKQKEEEQKRLEAEKKRLEEEKKKKEEELKQKAEDEKKKQEAEKKQKEEEQKRLEAEKKRLEEEKKKKEEELKRKAEDEKKKQEAEKKRKEEEQKRLEAEKKRLEEEKKKKEEELKQKAEEEKKKQEAERKQKEEEKKRLEEEKKRQEEEKKRLEEKRRQEEAEKKRKIEEEQKRQEAAKKKQEEDKIKKEEESKRKAEEEQKKAADEKRKAEEQEKKQKEADKNYDKLSITNKADFEIRDMLDDAENLLYMVSNQEVLDAFNKILKKNPDSPRANYMKGLVLLKIADEQKSNTFLEEGITVLQKVVDHKDVPDELLIQAGKKLAEKQLFRGFDTKASKTWQFLTDRFPDKVDIRNQYGVSLLMVGSNDEAKKVFKQVLEMDPKNGYAMVHYGFILKTHDNDLEGCLKWMTDGIASGAEGTRDGKFYFHLGDALQRLNQTENAYKIYEAGAENGLFLSTIQRSLYNVPTLTGRPWWNVEETGYQKYFKLLEDNWKVIRDEGLAQMDPKMKAFTSESESLRQTGDWKQFTLYKRGMKDRKNCAKAPKTCELIDQIPPAKTNKRGQVKFSVIHPGTKIWPHCGPTNCRIRAHLGLKVPEGIKIRVGGETRTWKEGKFIIFDDSFEHEVWHDGTEPRLVLIVDLWHPELSEEQKRTLTAI